MCTINILNEEGLYGTGKSRGQAGDVSVCKGCAGYLRWYNKVVTPTLE